MEKLVSEYAMMLNISVEDLLSKSRQSSVNDKRQLIWYLLRKKHGFKIQDIKEHFNRKQDGTIINGTGRVYSLIITGDKTIRRIIDEANLNNFLVQP